MNTYTYIIGNNLYINLTNKCTNSCVFCVRNKDTYEGFSLWLDKEPTVEEVIASAGNVSTFDEIVFCGYGEPTFRIDEIVKLGRYFKSLEKFVRLNTNGHANKINGKDVSPLLFGAVDLVSVSLNQSDRKKYQEICHSTFGEEGFDILLDFAKACKAENLDVQLSIVDVEDVDVPKCQQVALDNGIKLKVRTYIDIN